MWLFNLLAGLLLIVVMVILSREDEAPTRDEEDSRVKDEA
jgi:hypothetical protein